MTSPPDRQLSTIVEPDGTTAAQLQLDPFAERFRLAKAAADAGDPRAQKALGELYEAGKGAAQDLGMAADLYRAAARAGDARAPLLMGMLLDQLKKQPERVRIGYRDLAGEDPTMWLRQAAEAGLPEAQVALAQALRGPRGCEGDWIDLAQKAADQGYAQANLFLGFALLDCRDAPARRRALRALTVAADTLPIARLLLFTTEHPGYDRSSTTIYVPGDVEQAIFAVDLEERANDSPPDAPLVSASPFLGLMGWTGRFDDRLRRELEQRAGDGDMQSACNLAFMSLEPMRDKNDYATAATWYRAAARRGAARAQYHLGKLYRDGHGVEADRAKAAEWFYLAARQDYVPAEAALGDMLLNGDGIPANAAVALAWLRPAAAQGNPLATFDLGRMVYEGIGMAPDKPRGLQLIRGAATYDAGTAARAWLGEHKSGDADSAILGREYWGPGLDTGTGACQG